MESGSSPSQTIAVIVPTYRRPEALALCLAALARQERGADEILVVHRSDDEATMDRLRATHDPTVTPVIVDRPGQVAALNAGLARASTDIVAFTDDDAEPRTDWLRRMAGHYDRDPALAGVGGRDVQPGTAPAKERTRVGIVQLWGRVIGNHHLGTGAAREVDVIKGVNMSFRRQAIADLGFDERLRGSGAQVHNELLLCLCLRRRGLRLLYDPALKVDHHPAVRHDDDARDRPSMQAKSNEAHNETVALLEYLPPVRRVIFMVWALLVGTRANPGVLQLVRLSRVGEHGGWRRVAAALRGRLDGARTYRASRRAVTRSALG